MVTGFEGVLTEIDNDGPVGRATDSVERGTGVNSSYRGIAIRNIIIGSKW